jgi:hypothetical protein
LVQRLAKLEWARSSGAFASGVAAWAVASSSAKRRRQTCLSTSPTTREREHGTGRNQETGVEPDTESDDAEQREEEAGHTSHDCPGPRAEPLCA